MWQVIKNYCLALILTLLLYPSTVFFISYGFPDQAIGSLVTYQGRIVGSFLLGQKFQSKRYFHSRPVLSEYTLAYSNDQYFSNPVLKDQIQRKVKSVRNLYGFSAKKSLPSDMVLASGSDLDPHISFENAVLQLHYIAKVRHLSVEAIYPLLYQALDKNFVGLWGNTVVNVLKLNLLLDHLHETQKNR